MPRYSPRRPVPRAYDRRAAWDYALSHPVYYVASGRAPRELLYDFKVQTYVGRNILDTSMPDPAPTLIDGLLALKADLARNPPPDMAG